ncbi:hypothetical protein Tco_1070411 [Tanacetum coccineum]|uniref:Uncharacterized protein n=1 Tax=Tanacetum coccineum TaxID=301880 RepID=A0ABQ5HMQ1_9ASTR
MLHAYLLFEQCTRSFDNESIDTLDSVNNIQEIEVKHEDMVRGLNLERIISRWHMCKPIWVFFDNECVKDCRMWPTCNPDLSFCSGYDAIYGKGENGMLEQWMCFLDHERQSVRGNHMIFADLLKVRYGNKSIDDTTCKRRYYEWVVQNSKFNDKGMPKPWEPSFNEGHINIKTTISHASTSQNLTPKKNTGQIHQEDQISNIKTYFPDFPQPQLRKPRPRDYSYEEWLRIKLGHTNVSKSIRNELLNEWVIDSFDVEIYYGKMRDDPYSRRFDEYKEEKCEKYHGGTVYPWHDKGFNEEEQWESGIEKTNYEPPFVDIEIFEIKRYSFKGGKSFVCINKQLDDALPLGRANESRFMRMIRKEMNEEGGSHSKELEFEVTSTRIHMVKMGYEFAQDSLVKSSALAIIIQMQLSDHPKNETLRLVRELSDFDPLFVRKNTSIGLSDTGFGRGTQAYEDAQGYLRRNLPNEVWSHQQNSEEDGVSKDTSARRRGTKLRRNQADLDIHYCRSNFTKPKHGYAVSSLMDTAYWSSE